MVQINFYLQTTASAKVVITANEAVVGGLSLPLKTIVDSAVEHTAVEVVLVAKRTGKEVTMIPKRDLSLEEVNFWILLMIINVSLSLRYKFSTGNVKGSSNLSSRGNG